MKRTSLKLGSTQYNNSIAATSNRLLSQSGPSAKTYSYDAAGNITGDGSSVLAWNAQGRPTSVTVGKNVNNYLYNGWGERVLKTGAYLTQDPYRFVYDSAGHLIGEYANNNGNYAMRQETIWLGDIPVAFIQKNNGNDLQTYYLQTDHLNTPRIALNSSNVVVWRWDGADPFGNTAANQDPDGDGTQVEMNLRFPGQYYDVETGLHYNYFRDYNPATGRYIASDPIGLRGGLNTYGYVGGNPVKWVDPTGLLFGGSINAGECYGDSAAQYWADKQVQSGNPLYGILGLLASLWTPLTSDMTASMLGTAAYATVGIPGTLIHYTTVAGAEGIASSGAILPSIGVTLFGDGVYATTTSAAVNPFVPAASTIAITISGEGFIRIIPSLVYLNGGSATTAAWGLLPAAAAYKYGGSSLSCGCQK